MFKTLQNQHGGFGANNIPLFLFVGLLLAVFIPHFLTWSASRNVQKTIVREVVPLEQHFISFYKENDRFPLIADIEEMKLESVNIRGEAVQVKFNNQETLRGISLHLIPNMKGDVLNWNCRVVETRKDRQFRYLPKSCMKGEVWKADDYPSSIILWIIGIILIPGVIILRWMFPPHF